MTAQPSPSNIKSLNQDHKSQQKHSFVHGSLYSQSHQWVAVFIDGKFYLTNPSAFDKLQTLDKQITNQKQRLIQLNKVQEKKMDQSKKQALIGQKQQKQRKNSFESALSRECKTQINELKALRARIEAEKQLAEQEMKFQHKTIEIRKRRQLKQSTTFVIRNQRQKSIEQSDRKSRKSSNKNFMMAPHQLANRKSEEKQHQQVSQPKQKQYCTIAVEATGKKQKERSVVNGSQINSKLTQNSRSRYNKEGQTSKSKQKSFVITSRKVNSSYSRDNKQQLKSELKQSIGEKLKINSINQIERLNMKLKQMQQKLVKVELKQKELEEMEKQKVNVHEQKKQQKEKASKNSRISSKTNFNQKNEEREEDEKSDNVVKIQGIKRKEKKRSDGDEKDSLISQKILTKREEIRKIAMSRHKPRKLQIQSSIVAYNFTEDLHKQKIAEEQQHSKQRMSEEINELKRIIKQLKIDKIKQEVLIQELEDKSNRKQHNNFIEPNESNVTFQGSDSKTSSILNDDFIFLKQNRLEQQNQQSFREAQNAINLNQPTAKRQDRRKLKQQPLNSKTLMLNHQVSEKKSSSGGSMADKTRDERIVNPEDSHSKQNNQLKKKGVIIRQIINKDKFSSIQFGSEDYLVQDISLEQDSKIDSKSGQLSKSKIQSSQHQSTNQNEFDVKEFVKPEIIPTQIQVLEGFPIPNLPSTPLAEASQAQILALAKKICQIFEIKVNSREQLQFKKFKNCVILKTNQINKAIVWHFSGKFYIGGWDQQSGSGEDHKQGDGFEFVPGKHYYRGEFSQGKRNGHGTMMMIDGDIYKGLWLNGEKHGKGTYFEKKTNSFYEGEWKHNKRDGNGIYKLSNTQLYEGSFQNSQKSGKGFEFFPNGDFYIGEYKNGKFEGEGKYFWSNGSIYIGSFVGGEREGFGKWLSNIKEGDYYIGHYKKDKKQGKGKYVWAKGCIFEGEFKSDLKHGQGRVKYQDGREVKGIWQFGKLKKINKQQEDEKNMELTEIEPRIRPNMPRILQTPSRQMQQSKLINGI